MMAAYRFRIAGPRTALLYPMAIRAFAYQSAKRRWPGVVDRIADAVKLPIEEYLASDEYVDLRAKTAANAEDFGEE